MAACLQVTVNPCQGIQPLCEGCSHSCKVTVTLLLDSQEDGWLHAPVLHVAHTLSRVVRWSRLSEVLAAVVSGTWMHGWTNNVVNNNHNTMPIQMPWSGIRTVMIAGQAAVATIVYGLPAPLVYIGASVEHCAAMKHTFHTCIFSWPSSCQFLFQISTTK